MLRIHAVFPELVERGETLDSQTALKDLVAGPKEVAEERKAGIEMPTGLQVAIRDVLAEVLLDQDDPEWWHALRNENILKHPGLDEWRHTDRFEIEVRTALINVAYAACASLYSSITGIDPVHDYDDSSSLNEKKDLHRKLETLEVIAARELGIETA